MAKRANFQTKPFWSSPGRLPKAPPPWRGRGWGEGAHPTITAYPPSSPPLPPPSPARGEGARSPAAVPAWATIFPGTPRPRTHRVEDLRARAPDLWRTVQTARVAPEVRDVLTQVLEFWFFERFRGLTAKEIWAMLNLVTPIQETRAHQSIYAEGEAEATASVLKRLAARRFGPLPDWAWRRIEAAPVAQLDAWLDGIFDAESLVALIGPEAN